MEMVVALAVVGLLAGLVAGLMGVGGGLLMVPFLHYVAKLPWHQATAVSLVAIAIQAPAGLYRHFEKGGVRWGVGALLFVTGLAGVYIGTITESYIPVRAFRLLFAVVLAGSAWRILETKHDPEIKVNKVVLALVGVVAGVLAKWLGIGGGLVTTPAMALAGIAGAHAAGTSLVPVWTNAFVASVYNIPSILTAATFASGIILGLFGAIGSPIGAWASHALPEARLRRIFAIILGGVSAFMAASAAWNVA